jgi:hypothetical protein
MFIDVPSPSGHLYFAKAHNEGLWPIKMAREVPRYHAAELDRELMKYFGADDVESARRCSSVRRQYSAAAIASQTQ